MKLTINNAEFDTNDLTAEQREQLKAELEKPEPKGRWVPNIEDCYCFIDDSGDICIKDWTGSKEDKFRLSQDNVFKTKEETEKRLEYLEAVAVIKKDAEWFEPDWSDKTQNKYCGWYYIEKGTLGTYWRPDIYPGTIYFETKEKLEESFKKHRKEWLIYCGADNG
jgi:hypothetical protein